MPHPKRRPDPDLMQKAALVRSNPGDWTWMGEPIPTEDAARIAESLAYDGVEVEEPCPGWRRLHVHGYVREVCTKQDAARATQAEPSGDLLDVYVKCARGNVANGWDDRDDRTIVALADRVSKLEAQLAEATRAPVPPAQEDWLPAPAGWMCTFDTGESICEKPAVWSDGEEQGACADHAVALGAVREALAALPAVTGDAMGSVRAVLFTSNNCKRFVDDVVVSELVAIVELAARAERERCLALVNAWVNSAMEAHDVFKAIQDGSPTPTSEPPPAARPVCAMCSGTGLTGNQVCAYCGGEEAP